MVRNDPYEKAIRIRKKKKKRKVSQKAKQVEMLRRKYRELGPVIFAQEFLACPPLAPAHPDLGKRPEHIMLSEDQIKFLDDLFTGKSRYAILAAGRGAGKTLVLAVWIAWRIFCFNDYSINSMAGSQGQSTQIQQYINYWRRKIPEIGYELYRSIGGGPQEPPTIESRHYSRVSFLACSETASRSPHVNELIIDEVCSAEVRGNIRFVQAAIWQVSTSPNVYIIMSSTAHYIYGLFLDYWRNYEEYGYSRYRWAIAKHVSNDPLDKVYADKNPEHWLPNVWWITKDFIQKKRKTSSDSEWLCEALGGFSLASGNVYPTEDLLACICNRCEECNPFSDKCPLMEEIKKWENIDERYAGVDFGKVSPNALVITGRVAGNKVYVLYAEQIRGVRDEDVINWVDEECKKYDVPIICPDPAQWGMGQALEDLGYAVYQLEMDNEKRIWNARRFIERKLVVIPKKFEGLIRSLSNLTYDEKGKIIKIDDHLADAFQYAMSQYQLEGDFWAELQKKKKHYIENLW